MPRTIHRGQIERLVADGAQLVEVLPELEYRNEHIPDAVSLPLRELGDRAREVLDPSRAIVVYCFDSA